MYYFYGRVNWGMLSVCCMEDVCISECLLWDVPLYTYTHYVRSSILWSLQL